mgnify:CR=1 FL=1
MSAEKAQKHKKSFLIVWQLSLCLKQACRTLNIPTANEEFQMSEIQTWLFLVVAACLAIIIGRLGTVLREHIEHRKNTPNKLSWEFTF